jgi:DNA-binding NarL/FixJ family response regulator
MRIGLFSESDLFACGLQCLLKSNLHFESVSRFAKIEELTQALENGRNYNLLILDLDNISFDGLAFTRHILIKEPAQKILVLSSKLDDSALEMYKINGVKGFVDKQLSFEDLHQAVDECLEGKSHFPKSKSYQLKHFFNNFFKSLREDYQLSDREMEIMQLIFSQFDTNDIAEKLNLSPHTVRTHRKNIFKKLKIHSLSGLLHLMP